MRKEQKENQIFGVIKKIILNNKISIEDIVENTNLDEETIKIFLNSEVSTELTTLLDFLGIRIRFRNLAFKAYYITEEPTIIKITRVIKPYCSMYFDRTTGKYHRFKIKYKKAKVSENKRELIIKEMDDAVREHLNNVCKVNF